MSVKPIPEGYHTATPCLITKGAAKAIEFYQKAFGAEELMRFADPDGNVAHAEIKIGDSRIMLGDEFPQMGFRGPDPQGNVSTSLVLYVENVDVLFDRAVRAGGKLMRPVQDQFYGDRTGTLRDPFGHVWTLATHKEDLTVEELHRRSEAAMKKTGGA